MEEKREFLRIEDVGPVTYQRIFPLRESILKEGIRENISGGGVKLITEEDFSEGDILILKMELSDPFEKIFIETSGKVVWTKEKKIEGSLKYEVGVAYLDIPEKERKKIINYVFRKQRFLLKGKKE